MCGSSWVQEHPKSPPQQSQKATNRTRQPSKEAAKCDNFIRETPNNSNTSAGNSPKTPKSPESHSDPLGQSLFTHVPPVFAIRSLTCKPLVRTVEYTESFNCPPHVLWEQLWIVFYKRGAEVAGKLSDIPSFGAEMPQPAQLHQNCSSMCAEFHLNLTFYFSILIFISYVISRSIFATI